MLWFPTPYPDELLYSIFARYHVRSGNTSPKMTTEELFGKRTVRSVWDLPANLNSLLKRLGVKWGAEQLINRHTMYPYYSAFLLPEQAEKTKHSMMDCKGSTIHTRIGAAASNVKPKKNLWMCSKCSMEDVQKYGETYWHRVHQAPGVLICPFHRVFLEETNIPVKAGNQHEYIQASLLHQRNKVDIDEITEEEKQRLIQIAINTHSLLDTPRLQKTNNAIRERYMNLLKQKGYASLNGFVRREKVYQSFRTVFSQRCLEILQSKAGFKETDWLTMIFQKHRKSFHPIRHLLVMIYLETDLESLFEADYLPFGKGPWLCLNPACKGYQKGIVKNLTTTICTDTSKPVGTFQCKCGFIYSRRGPDKESADQYRIGTIKDYGGTWRKKLAKLVEEGYKLTDIAKTLQSDSATIKKYAAEMELEVPWKPPSVTKAMGTVQELPSVELEERKESWLKIQMKFPDKTKTELRKEAPDVYSFLYRNDKKWLDTNSPKKKRIATPNNRVNWSRRDSEVLKEVRNAVKNWDADSEVPSRITLTAIGRKLNRLSLLQKKAEKLPKTVNFIRENAETIVEFQKRRVEFIVQKLLEENERVLEWEIYRKAGLRPNVSKEVKRLITLRATEYETANSK